MKCEWRRGGNQLSQEGWEWGSLTWIPRWQKRKNCTRHWNYLEKGNQQSSGRPQCHHWKRAMARIRISHGRRRSSGKQGAWYPKGGREAEFLLKEEKEGRHRMKDSLSTEHAKAHGPQGTSHNGRAAGHEPRGTSHSRWAVVDEPQGTSREARATVDKPWCTSRRAWALAGEQVRQKVSGRASMLVTPGSTKPQAGGGRSERIVGDQESGAKAPRLTRSLTSRRTVIPPVIWISPPLWLFTPQFLFTLVSSHTGRGVGFRRLPWC